MTNVLPVETQKMLWRIHRARFVLALAWMLLALAVCMALALVPSYIALEMYATPPETPEGEKTAAAEIREMTKVQNQLSVVGSILIATSSPSDVILHALSLRPKGVTVDRIRYMSDTSDAIMMSGTASREALNSYRTILESDPLFDSVSVPVGALVGAEGARFSVTVTGQF